MCFDNQQTNKIIVKYKIHLIVKYISDEKTDSTTIMLLWGVTNN